MSYVFFCSRDLAPILHQLPSQCVIYSTKYIKRYFRSAKCFDNSIHANKEGSQRCKERIGGRREWGGRELASDPESQISLPMKRKKEDKQEKVAQRALKYML